MAKHSTDVLPRRFLMLKHCTLQTGWRGHKTGDQAVRASGGAWGFDAATATRLRAERKPTGSWEQTCSVCFAEAAMESASTSLRR